jgi:hypothetical protein
MKAKIRFVFTVFFVALLIFSFMACQQDNPGGENPTEPENGMLVLPDSSQISGVFTRAPELTWVTGLNEGQIRYSWTAAIPGTGVTYRLYVIEGNVTDAKDIIDNGNLEITLATPPMIRAFTGSRGQQYSAVVKAQRGTSTEDIAYSVVRTATPRDQHFDTNAVLTFATGTNEGEINYSWTAATPGTGLRYYLYVLNGISKNETEIVRSENLQLTTNRVWSGTFKSIPNQSYSAVLQVVDGTVRINSPIIQATTKDRESLSQNFDVRFGVIADTHIGGIGRGAGTHSIPGLPSPGFYRTSDRLAKALQWYDAQHGVDTLFIAGDLIQGGGSWGFNGGVSVQDQYALLGTTITGNKGDLQVIPVMGNHDESGIHNGQQVVEYFRSASGGLEPNAHYVINGYHFITLVGGAGNNNAAFQASVTWEDTTNLAGGGAIAAARPVGVTTGSASSSYAFHYTPGILTWLRERIEFARAAYAAAETPGRPIFIFAHWPVNNTIYGSESSGTRSFGDNPLNGWFANDPDVVYFSGHSHRPNQDPRSIWQSGFTVVNVSSMYWMSMESGFLGVNDNGTTDGITNRGTPAVANFSTGQGLIVSASGTRVTIKNYDFDKHVGPTPLGNVVRIPQTWEFDVAKPNEFPFVPARSTQRTIPVFDPAAAPNAALNGMITLRDIERTSVNVEFIQARIQVPNPVNEVVHSYRFEFRNTSNGSIINRSQWSDFMLTPRLQRPTYRQFIGGLTAGTQYELRIFAYSSFQAESVQFLTTTFTTLP